MSAHTSIFSAQAGSYLEQTVTLRGHIQSIRRMGNLAFVNLRDRMGTIQVVIEKPSILETISSLTPETPVTITAVIDEHPDHKNRFEAKAQAIEALAKPAAPLPVEIAKNAKVENLGLSTLFDYRPLTLRNEKVQAIFRIEAAFCRAFRELLQRQQFTEIHSPKIVATGTEGGAQLFSLEYFGQTAYLAQSPQFYKQMMVGAFERVFEIAPVYRAEEHDTARHLNEYVSMDLEMGFISSEQQVIKMETELLRYMFAYVNEHCGKELALHSATLPSIGGSVPQIRLEEACTLLRTKYEWRQEGLDLDPLGERLLCEHFKRTEGSELVFVTHYPAQARPFYTMPQAGTEFSHSFDLLFRGLEITTGGQRIHEIAQLEERIVQRGMDPAAFDDYLQCFRYGMPPHGGLAIGLERLTKQSLGLPNVKQASLFPRDRNRIAP